MRRTFTGYAVRRMNIWSDKPLFSPTPPKLGPWQSLHMPPITLYTCGTSYSMRRVWKKCTFSTHSLSPSLILLHSSTAGIHKRITCSIKILRLLLTKNVIEQFCDRYQECQPQDFLCHSVPTFPYQPTTREFSTVLSTVPMGGHTTRTDDPVFTHRGKPHQGMNTVNSVR